MKRFLSAIIVMIILVTAIPLSANAASIEGYYTYSISDGEAIIIDVDESISGYVIIPSTIDGYSVTAIGSNAFSYCSKITKVAVPGCVKTVGKSAFSNTSGLTEAIFCSGVETIGEYCFDYSSLIKIHLPVTVDEIGYAAFENTAVFYEGTEQQLQAINRPNKGTIIDIFKDADISYNKDIPAVDNEKVSQINLTNGCYTYNVSGGEAIIIDVDESISGYVIVPSTIDGYSVTAIGSNAFSYCSKITKVAVPGCVKTVGKSAFSNTSGLTEAIFCSGVETIGEYCFDYSSLMKIHLPITVDTIGYAAFDNTAVFYEGTEQQLQAINRPDKGTITDIFRDLDIKYNKTIPEIENSVPTTPDSDENDNGSQDSGFSVVYIFNEIISFFKMIYDFIVGLFMYVFA